MRHLTTNVLENNNVTSIVLVGPPASGKSTVRSLFSDYDVIGGDLEDYHENGELTEGWTTPIVSLISGANNSDRPIVCIEGAITETEVEFISEKSNHTLVIRVDVTDDGDRVKRHVERELSATDDEIISEEKKAQIQMESYQRCYNELPYPEHDVSILNEDSTTTKELSRRCGRLVSLLDDDQSIHIPGE